MYLCFLISFNGACITSKLWSAIYLHTMDLPMLNLSMGLIFIENLGTIKEGDGLIMQNRTKIWKLLGLCIDFVYLVFLFLDFFRTRDHYSHYCKYQLANHKIPLSKLSYMNMRNWYRDEKTRHLLMELKAAKCRSKLYWKQLQDILQ